MATIRLCLNLDCSNKFIELRPLDPWTQFCPACRAFITEQAANANQEFEELDESDGVH